MTRFLLIRHAVNDWVKTGKLAGRTPEVHLNDEGNAQADALGKRLADVKLTALYSSPLERTMETAFAIAEYQNHMVIQREEGILEVGYGQWQGAKISKLAQKKAWYTVQHFPTRMQFPDGETMRGAQARAVDTVERLYDNHRKGGQVALVGHSDVIKMILAHYLGMHLDMFQRIVVSPASISVLHLSDNRPMIEVINDTSHLPSKHK